jgi:hypothetical protein
VRTMEGRRTRKEGEERKKGQIEGGDAWEDSH